MSESLIRLEIEYQKDCPLCDIVESTVPLIRILLSGAMSKLEIDEKITNNEEAPIFKYYYGDKLIGQSKGLPMTEDKSLILVLVIHNILMGIWNTMLEVHKEQVIVKQVIEQLENALRYGQSEQWIYTINTLEDKEQIKGYLSTFPCKGRQKILKARLEQLEKTK